MRPSSSTLALSLWGYSLGETLLQDPVPLTEYYSRTLKDYKPLSWDTITEENKAPMIRVRNLQDDEFRELVRKAYPFIVDDCAPPDATLRDWSCADFGKQYPNEHMRAEYTPGQHHIYLKDPEWHTVQKPTATAAKHLSRGKPLSGPYIWHVKDETEGRYTKRELQRIFPVPYFLNDSHVNRNEAKDSFEFWFVLENGGSQAHADAYCETTISLQLRGRKKWRLGAFPNITNAFQPHSFHDAEIYQHDHLWQPEYEEMVEPGQCVVFPMGYIHETYVSEGDGGEDGCSVATTFQIQDPQPVYQWKNFMNRWVLSHYAREEPCLERMAEYAFLGAEVDAQPGPAYEMTFNSTLRIMHAAIDEDEDQFINTTELIRRWRRGGFNPPWTEVGGKKTKRLASEEKFVWMAEDAMLYHDSDGDGRISREEFFDSAQKFQALRHRLGAIKGRQEKSIKLPQFFELEKSWVRSHLCTDEHCPVLEQLERDYESYAKKSKKKPKKAESREEESVAEKRGKDEL